MIREGNLIHITQFAVSVVMGERMLEVVEGEYDSREHCGCKHL